MSVLHRLAGGGVEVLLVAEPSGLPQVLHWGAAGADGRGRTESEDREVLQALGRPISPSSFDVPFPHTILPTEHEGWEGRPAIAGDVAGRVLVPRWRDVSVSGGGDRLRVEAVSGAVRLISEWVLDASGVLRVWHEIVNDGDEPLALAGLEVTVPVSDQVGEVLDFGGRWTRERAPQRRPLTEGAWVRESRRGRTGHDAPTILALGTPGFDSGSGQVWAVHLAWSGDAVYRHDALAESGAVLGAGPLLRPGEVVLRTGESLRTPDAVLVWSGDGLDGIGARLHASLRARPGHPTRPRPVTLNTWEAVYFDHELAPLRDLAETAAAIGVERFVLDDGWFHSRRSDDAGLGDWWVDPEVWPNGLEPLADLVHGLGMELGLWFEPEMVNLDSDLARAHPEWFLQPVADGVRSWRNQYVLNVADPEVFEHLLESVSAVISRCGVDYVKWDQNRDIVEGVVGGRAAVHRHTEAVYALIDALRLRHPGLEIEACASGGARVDLGILERTDRVWASDTNDPVERLAIQRWTELLLPLELIGSHVGPARAHTTGRVSDLSLRIAVALLGHAGIEWDITQCSEAELDQLRRGVAAYRRLRPLLHSGTLTHPEQRDAGLVLSQVLAVDPRDGGVLRIARTATSGRSTGTVLPVAGLVPDQRYRVRPVPELDLPLSRDSVPPPWLAQGSTVLTGSDLARIGLRLPLLGPGQALVLELVPEPADAPA
ncbi:alpha-galactosidase [Serinibacter arcticus]|uniref:alpha-galactosidase n=1 Tax=Serinibacter arcticus TaxID=1655435 RepID=A0A2U1ZSD6_9MICO|nr:alpha-galactosidase [Serinibacter arcticus]PWD49898.1 alpha-galactosidase [Serinibacter arcticus]